MLSLGVYPGTGLAEAREKAATARASLAQGVDPSDERRTKQPPLMNELCLNRDALVASAVHEVAAPGAAPGVAPACPMSRATHWLPPIGCLAY